MMGSGGLIIIILLLLVGGGLWLWRAKLGRRQHTADQDPQSSDLPRRQDLSSHEREPGGNH